MGKSMMQMIYEWSMRHQGEYKLDDKSVEVDKEKLEWLQKAWDELVTDGKTLIKQIFQVLMAEETEDEDLLEIFLQLGDLLENIDNSIIMHKMDKWNELNQFINQKIGNDYSKMTEQQKQLLTNILQCISTATHNSDHVQKDILDTKLKNTIQNLIDFVNQQTPEYINNNIPMIKQLFGIILNYLQSAQNYHGFKNIQQFFTLIKQSEFVKQQKYQYALQRFRTMLQYKENKEQCKLFQELLQ